MRKITIIKGLAILMVLFSVTAISGFLHAKTNDLRILSAAEMQGFVGQYGCNECLEYSCNCQDCHVDSPTSSSRYSMGSNVYDCVAGGDDVCEDIYHLCGTKEMGGVWYVWVNNGGCEGPHDYYGPSDYLPYAGDGPSC